MKVMPRDRRWALVTWCVDSVDYIFGDARVAALWMRTRNPLLGDFSPNQMIRAGRLERLAVFILRAREAGRRP